MAQYPVYGIGVKSFMSYSGYWKEVHNCYLQIGAEGGIPALVPYLMFFRRGFTNLKQLRKAELDPEASLFVRALNSSLIGFVAGAFFAPEALIAWFKQCLTPNAQPGLRAQRTMPSRGELAVAYSFFGMRPAR